VTDDSAFKKQVRARMAETGEKYTTARRMVIAGRDPGQPPVTLRVHLNPYVNLELTTEAARAYDAADEPGQRDMVNRLLADHLEIAGAGEAEVAIGSQLLTVQALHADEIVDAIHRRIPRAAGVAAVSVSWDLDHVQVDVQAERPGMAIGHGGAQLDRLRTELEQLSGNPVQLRMVKKPGPLPERMQIMEPGRPAD
jgi:KH domain